MFASRLLAVTVLIASACAEQDPITCPPTHALFRPRPLQAGLAGSETSVVVRAVCKRYGARPTSVHVTVRDPSGASVPFTASEPSEQGETHTVFVRFVPSVGTSTVRAEFEPDLGDVEVALVGIRDRSSERPVAELELPPSCGRYHRAGSLVACGYGALLVYLDGGLLAQTAPSSVIAANEALWSWSDAGVTRWLGDGRLELTTPLSSFALAVSAEDERLVLDQGGDLYAYSVRDGGLERTALLVDAGVSDGFFHPPAAVDGGWVWIHQGNAQACFRGPQTELSCAAFEYTPKWTEGDGFWVDDGRLGFARFGAGPRAISFVSVNQPQMLNGSTTPQLQYGEHAVSVRPDTLELEAWPVFPITSVTPRYVFGVSGAHVSIYER